MRLAVKTLGLVLLLVLAVWAIRTEPAGGVAEVTGAVGAAEAAAPATPAATPPPGDPSWRHDPIWDDGKAEFCAYEVDWARYDSIYPGRALLVLVKEPWAPDLHVKADRPRADGFEVLKLNHSRDVPTGIYTYHQMASVYLRRDTGALEKLAASSTESCGISTAYVVDGRLATRSYFDGQGDREQPYPAGSLPEDGLPAFLRDWVAGPVPAELSVFPSLMFGRYPDLTPAVYRLSRSPAPSVEVPAGRFAGVELRLENREGWKSYTFENREPFRLLALAESDGTRYRLSKCERLAYWKMHDPGGEEWLPERVR